MVAYAMCATGCSAVEALGHVKAMRAIVDLSGKGSWHSNPMQFLNKHTARLHTLFFDAFPGFQYGTIPIVVDLRIRTFESYAEDAANAIAMTQRKIAAEVEAERTQRTRGRASTRVEDAEQTRGRASTRGEEIALNFMEGFAAPHFVPHPKKTHVPKCAILVSSRYHKSPGGF